MDRKALAVVIIFLSSLVVLLLLNLNQPATAPIISSPPIVPDTTVKPLPTISQSAKLNTTDVVAPVNETITPTPELIDEIGYPQPPAESPDSSPQAQASPSKSAAMQPWQAMHAWSPMPKASPLSW